jgi:hypothetical protein
VQLRQLLLIVGLLISTSGWTQSRHTLRGYVRDMQTGETLNGATITIRDGGRGVSTNSYGFFSITLPDGPVSLSCTYVGYETQSMDNFFLSKDTIINFKLLPAASLNQTVVVTSKKRESNVKSAQMGKTSLAIEQIKSIPAFMGEVDLLKVVQLLPGVRNAGEGSSGIYVRGGGPDQNLVLLDDAIVYNTGHLFGFFSVFNSDAVKNVSLIKGGMPAQYGGRLSSVLDVTMKDGNNQKTQVEGGIGLIASRLSIQGPLKKDQSSFIITGRRTYIDALTKPFIPKSSAFSGSGYYFYDLNAKANYRFNDKDRLFISGYFGRDVFDFVNGQQSLDVRIPWGNATGTVRWNHVFSKQLFANTTAVFNDYQFSFQAEQNNFDIKLASGIRDWGIKQDWDYYPYANHKIKFGAAYTFHRFTPSVVSGRQDSVEFKPQNAQIKYGREAALYMQDDWEISPTVQLNGGLRYSLFQQVGPNIIYQTDADGNRTDSTVFGRGDLVKQYGGLEPRATIRIALNKNASIKASASRNLQYVHLVSNSGTTLPTDIWVPSTYRVKPQISWLYAAGYFQNLRNNMFELSMEVYYKKMQNQIEYKEGYTPNSLDDTENSFVYGDGWSYGSEWLVNKVKGRFTGWVGYSLSWTWRKFPALNQGEKFPAKYDRRHDLSVVAMYNLNPKWKVSAVFVYGTGNAVTLPQRFYLIEGVLTQEYSRINQYRLPSYHRLDLSATYTPIPKVKRKIKSEWVFSVYNAYSRQNPYFIYFAQTGAATQGDLKIQAKQVSIFPIIPSVTWNFKF